jgi:hypothetical protein
MSHVSEQEPPTLAEIDRRIEERLAAEHEFNINFLAEVLVDLKNDAEMRGPPGPSGPRGEEGPPGKLPLVKLWTPETVYYAGDVVAYDGGTTTTTSTCSRRGLSCSAISRFSQLRRARRAATWR